MEIEVTRGHSYVIGPPSPESLEAARLKMKQLEREMLNTTLEGLTWLERLHRDRITNDDTWLELQMSAELLHSIDKVRNKIILEIMG